MKDLLLFNHVDENTRGKYEFAPLGILYLSAVAKKYGFDTDVIHGNINDIPSGYKFYGISCTTSQYNKAVLAIKYIREINNSSVIVIGGGAHFNSVDCVLSAIKDDWNYIVVGEGENKLIKLLTGKTSKKILDEKETVNINDIPLPDFNALDIKKYGLLLSNGKRAINLITSRGCPFKCSFCSTSNTKFRQRSIEVISKELSFLKEQAGFSSLMFVDDNISINKRIFNSLLTELKTNNFTWRSYGRTNSISNQEIKKMSKAGCLEIAIGAESGSQKILNMIGKNNTVERNTEFVKVCQENNIICNAMLIIGLPGETEDTAEETIEWAKLSKPEAFGYNMFMPFPDSPIVKNYNKWKNKIKIHDYSYNEAFTKANSINKCFVSTDKLSRERILELYNINFEKLVAITGFDPRLRTFTSK